VSNSRNNQEALWQLSCLSASREILTSDSEKRSSLLIVEHLLTEDVGTNLTQTWQPYPLSVPPWFSDQPSVPG
jgi:hypothetical protein